MKVRLVQLLCPSRHCVLATAYESRDGEEVPEVSTHVREVFAAMVESGANPWCGICRSRDLHTLDAPTRYRTLQEAAPHLRQLEDEQRRTREFFRGARN